MLDILKVFVGLDYHQDSVQVCVLDSSGAVLRNTPCPNDWRAVEACAQFGGPVEAGIEACCGAAHLAEELMSKSGWSVNLAHPGFVARMKQNPDKTDHSDARLLADLSRVGYLPRVWLAPEELRELRSLVRYRHQLVCQRRNVKLRIRAILREKRLKPAVSCRPWTKAWRRWLEALELGEHTGWIMQQHLRQLDQLDEQIQEVEGRLADATKQDAVVEKLMEIKGIGLITAVTLRAEIGRFDRFQNGKQLSRYCGLSPRNASSGNRQADAGLIKAGNPLLRTVLIEAAHRLMRWDSRWVKFRLQMKSRGKATSVIAAAVANRFVRWLYHQMQPLTLAQAV